jgi:hypothetical protein
MAIKGDGHTYLWLLEHRDYPHKDWCLIWPFFKNKHGRGVIGTSGDTQFAARVMCELVKGEPPTPEHTAAHGCGNGHLGCTNPHHLDWKTKAENMEDCITHGTQPKHRLGPRGHFSPPEVEEIKRLLKTSTQLAVAQLYKVTESTIGDIARGRYYARPSKIKFWTPEEDDHLRDCVKRGLSFPEMSREIGRPLSAITGHAYRLGLKSGRPPNRSDYSTVSQRQGQ